MTSPVGRTGSASERRQMLQRRGMVLRAIRQFFDERGFVEVDTPLLVTSPGIEEHIEAFSISSKTRRRYLITSPEFQMKRLLAQGLDKIYQLSHCFRADESGVHHEPEFTMLEWYRTHQTHEMLMRDTEELVSDLAAKTKQWRSVVHSNLRGCEVNPPWVRETVDKAFVRHANVSSHELVRDEDFFRTYVEKVEPRLGEHKATFVTDWPARMASLAQINPKNPEVALRFEGYVAGIELCNGFTELTDAAEQRLRFKATNSKRKARGAPAYPLDEIFLNSLATMPPSAGNALGVDRLMMLLMGKQCIQDVMPFSNDTL